MLLYNKAVDYSTLKEGFAIPISYQRQTLETLGLNIPRGQKVDVEIEIGGQIYQAILTNIQFDEKKYPTHGDLLQIRYRTNGDLAKRLGAIFYRSKDLFSSLRTQKQSIRRVPNDKREYLVVYSTDVPNVLSFECITNEELLEETHKLRTVGEEALERIFDFETTDDSASIQIQTRTCKVRKLNRAIGTELKRLYDYRCQICGLRIGERYDSNLIHSHHIQYFTQSINNDANNILIVCPNHHGIIHNVNPTFDFREKTFVYSNGYREGLVLNKHI